MYPFVLCTMSLNSRKSSPKRGNRLEEGDNDPPVVRKTKKVVEEEEEDDITWSSCTKFWTAIFFVVAISSLVIILIAAVPAKSTGDMMHRDSSIHAGPLLSAGRLNNKVARNFDFSKYLQQIQESSNSSAKREIAEALLSQSNTTGTTATLSEEFQTNITHEGNNFDMIIHFTFDSMAALNAYQKLGSQSRKSVSQPLAGVSVNPDIMPVTSAADCAPGYTLGVNLTEGTNYMIDTGSITRLDPQFAVNTVLNNVATWNAFIGKNIYGNRVAWYGVFNESHSNGKNEITYGSISPTNILGLTIVYGYFSSYAITQRRIVEFDIIFADASQTLGDCTLDPTTHDYPRVAMHEMGHGLGLLDVYLTGCDLWTIMFGSSPAGRVQPRAPLSYSDGISISALYPDNGISPEQPNRSSRINSWLSIYLSYVIVILQCVILY